MSITKPTVIVLGAGASCEYSFPLGTQLLGRVKDALTYDFQMSSRPRTGSLEIFDTLREMFPESQKGDNKRVNQFLVAASTLSKLLAFNKHASIDEAIHLFAGQNEVIEIGKLAIASSIRGAEAKCLEKGSTYGAYDASKITGWMADLFTIAIGSLTKAQIAKAFENITVINFNYDRSFENFIFHAIQSLGIAAEEAAETTRSIKILRPYGSLGELRSLYPSGIPFGHIGGGLQAQAQNIKTYTEQNHDPELIASAKTALAEAKTVMFLGFGFHKQNLDILQLPGSTNFKTIFATAKDIDKENHDAISERLLRLLRPKNKQICIENLTCSEMFERRRKMIELAVN